MLLQAKEGAATKPPQRRGGPWESPVHPPMATKIDKQWPSQRRLATASRSNGTETSCYSSFPPQKKFARHSHALREF